MNIKRWESLGIGVALLALSTHPLASDSKPTGFRGIKWGEDFSIRAKEMTFLGDNNTGAKWYIRTGDKMSLGDAKLARIAYGYRKNKFFSVYIYTFSAKNGDALLRALRDQFGEHNQDYQWYYGDVEVNIVCGYRDEDCIAKLKLIGDYDMGPLGLPENRKKLEEAKKRREAVEKDF